jgi:hypothetical protein
MTHARPRSGLLVASATALMGTPRLIPLPDVDTSGSSSRPWTMSHRCGGSVRCTLLRPPVWAWPAAQSFSQF